MAATGAPARHRRIAWANEIFAKLLLSGADGVAVGDIAEDDLHPQFETIGLDGDGPASTLSTKLFRPEIAANQHEPVHRIVAEYGAAQHLIGLIDDPAARLNLSRSMALIAPNGVVRDDLRVCWVGWRRLDRKLFRTQRLHSMHTRSCPTETRQDLHRLLA